MTDLKNRVALTAERTESAVPQRQPAFSPGPWSVRRSLERHDGEYDFAINAGSAKILAETFGRDIDGGRPPAEANAHLIAAAPDMYEAGAALITDIRRRYPGEELRCEYMRALDAALRKARGEGPAK